MQRILHIHIVLLLTLFFSIQAFAKNIDINTADEQALSALNGVGPKKAVAIVAYRKQHGPFKSVDDLVKVPGIGPKILEKNRDLMVVSPVAKRKYVPPPVRVYIESRE